ncbi:MAG: ATP-binding protein [Lachnospiraceae bacterium]|nr:ATP-binding protein [Lachnospiraceae bacterium]
MKTINIYALTRIEKPADLTRYDRQMSGRNHFLKIKDWEIRGLKALTTHLYDMTGDFSCLNFYYSFTIPKLGKEFDLLRINRDTIINIELKSHSISDERIKYQLQLNRNYLASLNRSIRSYTYLSNEDRLFRLSNSGNLIEADWDTLCRDILGQDDCIEENIEQFFKEEKYLISPLTDPERFLKGNYFLTSQQKDIKKQILTNIRNPHKGIMQMQGFMGLPGTGKTLLLYDIAMELSSGSRRVCVLHFGSFPDEMRMLDSRLKRVDFYACAELYRLPVPEGYSCIFVDEGHRMSKELLDELISVNQERKIPVIISYDYEAIISPYERPDDTGELIDSLPDFIRYRLTNRIRMNSELSSYICCVMNYKGTHRMKAYPSVSLYYANDTEEADIILNDCTKNGYIHISDNSLATCREFTRVVMTIDSAFYYDEDGFLRSSDTPENKNTGHNVRRLFHGLNRAQSALSIIVINNPDVFDVLLTIAQGH